MPLDALLTVSEGRDFAMQPTTSTVAARPTTANPLRRWLRARSWRWWAACWLILGLSEFAAIFTQMDSRVHAVAPVPDAAASIASYDAGWPLIYAHVRSGPMSFVQWQHFVHQMPPMARWNGFILILDIAWTGIIFALGIALPVIAWRLELRSR